MSAIESHPAYLSIEDRLDALGQRLRVFQLLRGVILFSTSAVVLSIAAAGAAHLLGQSGWTKITLGLWVAAMLAALAIWIIRPLVFRPRPLDIARLVEGRVDGLHNGLTNSLLLAQADDLRQSPWTPAILDEIAARATDAPLEQAVRFGVLRRLGGWAGLATAVGVLLVTLWPASFAHGWRQLFSPADFVPRTGAMRILSVSPGDATLVMGQPLEIAAVAEGPGAPEAQVLFDAFLPPGTMYPLADNGRLRYSHRIDHLEQPLRYRVEVAGTQSDWYAVRIVRQVKLQGLSLKLTPPSYTRQPSRSLELKAEEAGKTPLSVFQGTRVELAAVVDVAVKAAMLQIGDAAPRPMSADTEGMSFSAAFEVTDDTSAAILLTDAAGQIIARLPETPLLFQCQKDAAPTIDMKWPVADVSIAPDQAIVVRAVVKDDHGLSAAQVLLGAADAPLNVVTRIDASGDKVREISFPLTLLPEQRRHGQAVRVQVQATDNRALADLLPDGGPQTASSAVYELRFRDPAQIAQEQKESADALRQRLLDLLRRQQELHARTLPWRTDDPATMQAIHGGQGELRTLLARTVETFVFDEQTRVVQKTLGMLASNPAREAVDLAASLLSEPDAKARPPLLRDLLARQRRIISTLESLLAALKLPADPATLPTSRPGGDLANRKEEFERLNEALKAFMKEEQRILDQTAHLAKKPVDDFTDADKKLLEDLKSAQEKLDAFLQEKVSDFSKNAEQDMANASMLKELLEVYSEVTMAKDALKAQAIEIAVSLEESGLEKAQEITSNLEKWLMETPDRIKWTMEDPLTKTDTPMAELPTELEDMIGELMEQQEDLFEDIEDANANWADSLDKGAGWGTMDGPIASMSAKGVTGNALPSNNEMGGRSGEGRSGKSQGEFVEETASGKGGRMTPTRLDPTAFQQGQVKDESKDPVGGATGGGKISGQGGAGLEGPVPPKLKQEMQRLAQKQAQIRNNAERLNLQYGLGRYDNFKLAESIALMRRTEADLQANRYQNAMVRRDVTLDRMDESRMLVGGRIHVSHDSTPAPNGKAERDLADVMKGKLPETWSEALKAYYQKLASE